MSTVSSHIGATGRLGMPIENRPAERETLESGGRRALEEAAQQEPQEVVRDLRPLLRLWHYPAFFAHTSWTVFGPIGNSHTRLVRQVRWDRPHDMSRFSDPDRKSTRLNSSHLGISYA